MRIGSREWVELIIETRKAFHARPRQETDESYRLFLKNHKDHLVMPTRCFINETLPILEKIVALVEPLQDFQGDVYLNFVSSLILLHDFQCSSDDIREDPILDRIFSGQIIGAWQDLYRSQELYHRLYAKEIPKWNKVAPEKSDPGLIGPTESASDVRKRVKKTRKFLDSVQSDPELVQWLEKPCAEPYIKFADVVNIFLQNYNSARKKWEERRHPKNLSDSQIEGSGEAWSFYLSENLRNRYEIKAENSDLINKALEKLKDDERELIQMKYLSGEEMTNEAIAQRYGCSADTIDRRLTRAMIKMKEYLEKQ